MAMQYKNSDRASTVLLANTVLLASALASVSALSIRAQAAEVPAQAPAQVPTQRPEPTETVVVTATRTQQSSFVAPAAIDAVEGPDLRNHKLRVNFSEGM